MGKSFVSPVTYDKTNYSDKYYLDKGFGLRYLVRYRDNHYRSIKQERLT
jgi:hypothetical protein